MKTPFRIYSPVIERRGDGFRVQCRVDGAADTNSIWFEIDRDPGVLAVDQIADAFVLPSVIGALARGCDVHFNFPVSELLLLNLQTALLPLLVHLHSDLFPYETKIVAESVMRLPGAAAKGSATGLSCGLDSLATIASLLNLPASHSMRLGAVAFFDAGNHDPLHSGDPSPLFAARVAKVRACTAEIKVPLFVVQSNVDVWFPGTFARLHTLRNASAAFLLAPAVRHYHYANAVPIWAAHFTSTYSGYGDQVILPLLSSEALTFHSGTPALDSVAKTKLIAGLPLARRHLNVCLFEAHNCSRCEKCLRRMLALDLVGALEEFSDVFDLQRFIRARRWYVGYVMAYASPGEPLQEMADAIRATNYTASSELTHRARWWIERLRRSVRQRLGLVVDRF